VFLFIDLHKPSGLI